jgi:hypothetical protein
MPMLLSTVGLDKNKRSATLRGSQRRGRGTGLTNTTLLQPRQCVDTLPTEWHTGNIPGTVSADTALRAPEHNTRFDQACQPQHKQNKRAYHHYAGEQRSLCHQVDHDCQEDNRDGADGNPVREIPVERMSAYSRSSQRYFRLTMVSRLGADFES